MAFDGRIAAQSWDEVLLQVSQSVAWARSASDDAVALHELLRKTRELPSRLKLYQTVHTEIDQVLRRINAIFIGVASPTRSDRGLFSAQLRFQARTSGWEWFADASRRLRALSAALATRSSSVPSFVGLAMAVAALSKEFDGRIHPCIHSGAPLGSATVWGLWESYLRGVYLVETLLDEVAQKIRTTRSELLRLERKMGERRVRIAGMIQATANLAVERPPLAPLPSSLL
jgi:hypothetical protein